MKVNSKYASSLTYGPREEQILKAIDENTDTKYPSKNEVLRRGLHSFTYLYNVNENSEFVLLHTLLESISKNLDRQTLVLAKDIALLIQSILVVKYGLAKADSFATIPNTLENLTNVLQQDNVKQTEIEADVKKTIADLAISLKTVFMESEWPQTNIDQHLASIVAMLTNLNLKKITS